MAERGPVTTAAIDRLAVASPWSRDQLENWCAWAEDLAKRRGLAIADHDLAVILDCAVEVGASVPEHLRPSSYHFVIALERGGYLSPSNLGSKSDG